MSKDNRRCVDASYLTSKQPQDKFHCCICLQFMTHPYSTDCQSSIKHVFGVKCIEDWVHKNYGKKECPLCREIFKNLIFQREIAQQAAKFTAKCPECTVIFPAAKIQQHLSQCEKRFLKRKGRIVEIVQAQKKWLQKQINPHLRESHKVIYQTYVQEWKWLESDPRNWKWWWWCNNPWWQGKSCPTCNDLWHKYENQIDALEVKRVSLLEELGIKLEEENQAVECQSS